MKGNYRWSLIITILAFIISLLMSLFSTLVLQNVNLLLAIVITFLFILIGIVFDIIGVAVTSGDETAFHSMSSRKVKGGKMGVKLLKNASKVSSFCCDVVGDICGIISGATGVTIVTLLIIYTDYNELLISLLVTALISSLTIGGKALGKNYAMNKSTNVIKMVATFLSVFSKN